MFKFFLEAKRNIVIFLCIIVIGLTTIKDYGISVDESTYVLNVKFNYELITNQKPIPIDLKHYGIVFDTVAETLFQLKQVITKGIDHNPLEDNQLLQTSENLLLTEKTQVLFDRIQDKHWLTFFMFLVTCISVAIATGTVVGKKYAWLGVLNLSLLPRFWGHSFFNPRDIPFAAMFTLTSVLGAYLINLSFSSDRKLNFKCVATGYCLTGVSIGLTTGIRTGGFFLLFFIPLTHFLIALTTPRFNLKLILINISLYLGMGISWAITTTIVHPASWANPSVWFIETLKYLSQHGWSYTVLFEGQQISANALPWYYLPKWFAITTPELAQILFFISLLLIITKFKKLSISAKAIIITANLQIFILPLIAIVKQSTLYDGIRHFLFVLPPLAILNSIALVWLYKLIKQKYLQIFFISLCGIFYLNIALDMYQLHPYQYIYFNQTAGGLAKLHNRFETDYWGVSLTEATQWLNKNVKIESKVYSTNAFLSKNGASKNLDFDLNSSAKDIEQQKMYYVALPRWDFHARFPDCPIEHMIKRQNSPLTIIKKCNF